MAYGGPRRGPENLQGGGDEKRSREFSVDRPLDLQEHESSSTRRIYILGLGSVGTFVAHSLASIVNPPPITVLLRGRAQRRKWAQSRFKLSVTTRGALQTQGGFDVDVLDEGKKTWKHYSSDLYESSDVKAEKAGGLYQPDLTMDHSHGRSRITSDSRGKPDLTLQERRVLAEKFHDPLGKDKRLFKGTREAPRINNNDLRADCEDLLIREDALGRSKQDEIAHEKNVIHHLIVSAKAPGIPVAIKAWRSRLRPYSTILFLTDGMGIIEELNSSVFPDPNNRPRYMIGISSHHVVFKPDNEIFEVAHVKQGTLALSVLPETWQPNPVSNVSLRETIASSQYLLDTLTRTPILAAVGIAPLAALQQQFDRLVVSAIIQPLSAVLSCPNGDLVKNFHVRRILRLLLAELTFVIRSLPELQNVPNVQSRFDTVRFEKLVIAHATKTAHEESDMLVDMKSVRRTEIDYLNGYLVKRGEELGIQCMLNYMLMHQIKAKEVLISRAETKLLPLADEPEDAKSLKRLRFFRG